MSYFIKCGSASVTVDEKSLIEISQYWRKLVEFRGAETVNREIVIDPTETSPEFITAYFEAAKSKNYDTLVLDYPTEAPYFGDTFEDIALIEAVKYRLSMFSNFDDILLYGLDAYKQIISANITMWCNTWSRHRAWNDFIQRLPDECFELIAINGKISASVIVELIAKREFSKLSLIKKHHTSRIFLSNSILTELLKTKNLEYISLLKPESTSDAELGLVCEIPDEPPSTPVKQTKSRQTSTSRKYYLTDPPVEINYTL